MSAAFRAKLKDLVIPNGGTDSNAITLTEDSAAISIIAPSTLDVVTYTIQVSNDGTNWATYQEGTTLASVAVPAANFATVYQYLGCFVYFRIHGSGPAGAARTFLAQKIFTV